MYPHFQSSSHIITVETKHKSEFEFHSYDEQQFQPKSRDLNLEDITVLEPQGCTKGRT